MVLVFIVYADFKLSILINRQNPLVSFFVEEQILDSDDRLHLMDENLRFAFTIEGYADWELKDDPRYVKFLVRLAGRNNGQIFEQILDFHKCTDKDLEKFAPPTQDAERTLNKILSNPKRTLFCIDWDKIGEEMEIWGTSHYPDFRFVDIELVPCQYLHNFAGWTGDKVTPECLYNKTEAENYLKNLRAIIYISEHKF